MTRRWTTFFAAAVLVAATAAVGTVQQDFIEALRAKAEQGDAQALASLGYMYSIGFGVPQDDAEAVRWYRLAADQGHDRAQYNLGLAYANGHFGVPQDEAEAVRWYRLAADQRNSDAQYNLGIAYDNGQGVPEDDAEAVRWYRLAAAQGDDLAMFNLGAMYYEGRGVPKDDVQTYMWFNLSASRSTGEPRDEAVKLRDQIGNLLTPDQLAEAQRLAREWDEAHPR